MFHRQSLELQLIMLAAVEVQPLQQAAQVVMVADSVWVEMAARHRQVTVGMARRVMAARVVAVARVD